jgi:hypothetical protein
VKRASAPACDDPRLSSTLADYAAAYGLHHRLASLALPKATQLMRHGFMQETRSVARGTLPGGLESSWLAQVEYAYEGTNGIERSPFTLVLTEARESAGFAVRVLCHDRQLSKRDRANPDQGRQVVQLDDRAVKLESIRFLERYQLSTDHDQDQLRVWQIFDPSLIDWLTVSAPPGFSFELQDGALCCFVPGFTADEAELDALCEAAARVFAHVADVEGHGDGAGPRPGTRGESVERALAEHPFATPPQSTKAAAKEFRRGLRLGDQAWALGAEAFFRSHASSLGLTRVATSAYRAEHVATILPGILAHAARGPLRGSDVDAFLVLTNDQDYETMGWSSLVVDLDSPALLFSMAQGLPHGDAAERGAIRAGTDGRSLIVTALDGGARDRSATELNAFYAAGCELVERLGTR